MRAQQRMQFGIAARLRCRRCGRQRAHAVVDWQVGDIDRAAGGHAGGVIKRIAQLAQIAGPAPGDQLLQRRRRDLAAAEQAPDHLGQVGALAQRRQPDLCAIEPVVQVVAETSFAHQRLERRMRGGDHADIHQHRTRRADRMNLALRQHAQQARLQCQRHVANLVEEQRAAVGFEDQSALAFRRRARKTAGQVPEEFALDQGVGNRRTIHRNERTPAPLAACVHRLCKVLLAAAGLAGHQQADRRIHQLCRTGEQGIQRRIAGAQLGQRRRQYGFGPHARDRRYRRRRGGHEQQLGAAGAGDHAIRRALPGNEPADVIK